MTNVTERQLVKEWKDVPIGTEVWVMMDDGTILHTKTRSEAELLQGHSAVIWLEDINGCYALGRVRRTPILEDREEYSHCPHCGANDHVGGCETGRRNIEGEPQ